MLHADEAMLNGGSQTHSVLATLLHVGRHDVQHFCTPAVVGAVSGEVEQVVRSPTATVW